MNESITYYELYYANAADLPCWQLKAEFPSPVEADQWLKAFGDDHDFYQFVKVTRQSVTLYDRRKNK